MARLPAPLRPLWPYLKVAYTVATRVLAPLTAQLSRLRGGRLPRRGAPSFEAVASEVEQVRPPETLHRAVPAGSPPGGTVLARQATETVSRLAVAVLREGRVMAPHAVVVSRSGVLIEEASPYFGTARRTEHPLYLHPFPPPPVRFDERVGVLATRGDGNFYHFVLDVLPKLGVLEQATGIAAPERWYVPRAEPFQQDLLELAGVPADRTIDSTATPHLQASELVVPGIPDAHLRTPPWVVDWLRARLRPAGAPGGRRLYVTRGRVPNNRIVRNEDELLDALAPLGIERVDPGRLPVAEQLRLFAEAEVVVAPHGAALANLVAAGPGVRVVEMFAPDFVQGCYWKLVACIPQAQYRYVVGAGRVARPDRMRGVGSDITVDVAIVLEQLRSIGVS